MLVDQNGMPVDPLVRVRYRKSQQGAPTSRELTSALDYLDHTRQAGIKLTGRSAKYYGHCLGMVLQVLPYALQEVAKGGPVLDFYRRRPSIPDLERFVLAHRVVELADSIGGGA